MFGSKNESPKIGRESRGPVNLGGKLTTISNGTVFEGDITSEGDIRIEGTVKGTVKTKAKLAVGKTGKITGDVSCRDADVEGKLEGTVVVGDLLFIRGHAVLEGTIQTSKLVIESGAVFNGSCTMASNKSLSNGNQAVKQPFGKKQAV